MNKSIKMISFGILSSIIVSMAAIVLSSANLDTIRGAKALSPYELNLNNNNIPTIEDGNGTLVLDEYQTFVYTNASNEDNYHVVLSSGGTMKKVQESRGLSSIAVEFDAFNATVKLESDYVEEFTNNHYVVYIGSGYTYSIEGNYWKITCVEGQIKIKSLTVNYNCETASERPDSSSATVTGLVAEINEGKNQFATVQTINGEVYFTIRANRNGNIKASDLQIFDNSNVIDCSFVEYRDLTKFEAYFNISSWQASHKDVVEFYTHLNVHGSKWTTVRSDGNVGLWGPDNTYYLWSDPAETSSGYIQLKNNSWTESDTKFHQAKLYFGSFTDDEFGVSELINAERSGSNFIVNIKTTNMAEPLDKELLTIRSNDGKYPVAATSAVVTAVRSSSFEIKITYKLEDIVTTYNHDGTYYAHLYIDGDTWDDNLGDLRISGFSDDDNWFSFDTSGYRLIGRKVYSESEKPSMVAFRIAKFSGYDGNALTIAVNDYFCDKKGKAITEDGGKTCDPKVKYSQSGGVTAITFEFYSASAYTLPSCTVEFSWNNIWSSIGTDFELCKIKFNDDEAKSVMTDHGKGSGADNWDSWETGHNTASASSFNIKEGTNVVVVTATHHEGVTGKANSGYRLSLYSITLAAQQ